ncbi:MAG: hypothetical protein QW548_01200 [Candidatus Aenigmatarchaeota archaeon]
MALYRVLIGDPIFKPCCDASRELSEIVEGMWAELGAKRGALGCEKPAGMYVFHDVPFAPGSAILFEPVDAADALIGKARSARVSKKENYDWVLTEADYGVCDGKGVEALKELMREGITFGTECAVTLLYSKNPDPLLARDRSEQVRAERFTAYFVPCKPNNGSIYNLVGRAIARHYQGMNPEAMFKALAEHAAENGHETKLRILV